jgi:GntR family transcriptional regulator
MVEFGASRNVVREALAMLQAEGLVRRVRGTGTLVRARKNRHPFDRLHGILEGGNDCPQRVENTILNTRRCRAVRPVTQRLGIATHTELTLVEYLTRLDGQPFLHGTSYLPIEQGADLLVDGDFSVDFYRLLESVGVALGRSRLVLESVAADEADVGLLGIAVGAPLILFERTIYDPDGAPVEFGFLRCRADRVALVLELPRCTDGAIAPERANATISYEMGAAR